MEMRRRYHIGLCVYFVMLVGNATCAQAVKKPWTFLVYLAAANTLSPFAPVDLAEMIKVGSNENVNVIVYLTVFDSKGVKSTKRLYIEKGVMKQIGATTVEDSGDVHTLMRALEWAFTDYPADHYCVDLWNHGGGILNFKAGIPLSRGVCYDDATGNYLTDRNCLRAFYWAKNTLNGGKNIDVVATDACLMGMLEFAYTLTPCTDFTVGSETTIPGNGYEYDAILNAFVNNVPSPRDLAEVLVQTYQQEYVGTPGYTLSAVDESRVGALATNINRIATQLLDALTGPQSSTVRQYLRAASTSVPTFGEGTPYIDLFSFYKMLGSYVSKMGLPAQQASALKQLLQDGQALIAQCVIAKVASVSYKTVGGLSLYFPQQDQGIDPSYPDLYWTQHNPALYNLFQEYIGA
jgi:hypothetical protein